MPQIPLNASGGTAPRIEARMTHGDHDRLVELARKKGLKRPEMIRELMRWALDKAEAEEREERERAQPLASGSPGALPTITMRETPADRELIPAAGPPSSF
jgi:hypothetical protein